MQATPVDFAFHDLEPGSDDFRADVLQGLAKPGKEIPPKYFYDAEGSKLFSAICELPEYYPTRTEIGILAAQAEEIARLAGPDSLILEYGSGSSQKIRLLIQAMRPCGYVPIEICRSYLQDAAAELTQHFPGLPIHAICADYTQLRHLPAEVKAHGRHMLFFPGSTIGNCTPLQATQLLKTAATLLGPSGALLIGVDLKKDPARLNAAYNDTQGVTAAFNLNLLRRINQELDGDFDLANFRHRAFYNADQGRVEMHLESLADQRVRVADVIFDFRRNESIHTENSYKYTTEEFRQMAETAGFKPLRVWTDAEHLFSVHYLQVGVGWRG
ncbi:L-histidine N(alpha)-methyltransferase [Thermithiobacillus plumbiphilus]|uniref:L-histidine N(Alpha)-methyltransferase n=1 Tax=Thermithiobacillus plumbiphilus TaxID=1729899 RepID=A0ABU9DCH4_9PROT